MNTLLWSAGFGRANFFLLPRLREMGCDAVEMASFDFSTFPVAEARRAAEQNHLATIMCSAFVGDMSLCTDDEAVLKKSREFLKTGIKTTAELGAKTLVGPYCSAVGLLKGRRRTEDEWKRCVDELRAIAAVAEEYGVSVALEPLNRFETYFLNTAEDGAKLCDEVGSPAIGLLIDTFHSNIEEKSIPDAYRKAGKHLKHVHTCENDRGIPGSGHVDWKGVFQAIREVNYQGFLVIESFGSNIAEIAAAACIWRDLAPSSEAIAAEGLRFLKTQAAAVAAA